MFRKMHKNQSGQAALETAIILIAFVVVASVFAFTILSAGSASTEKGKQAIAAGMEGVQSSLQVKGSIIATSASGKATFLKVTVAVAPGGSPVNLTPSDGTTASKNVVQISYLDDNQSVNNVPFDTAFLAAGHAAVTADPLLREGQQAELTVTLPSGTNAPAANTKFTLEIKPSTGAVLKITRTLPGTLDTIMDLN